MNQEFIVPFLKPEFIEEKADEIIKKLHPEPIPPVDVEKIVEVRLRIRVIPKPNFKRLVGIDAFISNDLKEIWVDQWQADFDSRYRFSLAHELGHRELHGDLIRSLKFKDDLEWRDLYQSLPPRQLDRLDRQARWFAGYLLIPRIKLMEFHEKIWRELVEEGHDFEDDRESFKELLIRRLAKRFCVSEAAMQRQVNYIAPPVPKF